jgi:hypothetical protein
MTSKQKAEIKKVLIELNQGSENRGALASVERVKVRPVYITPYLERIVKIMEEK